LLAGERRNGRWSLDGVLFNCEVWPVSRYLSVVPVLVVLFLLGFGAGYPLDHLWKRAFFSWLPGWFTQSLTDYAPMYSRGMLIGVFAAWLLFEAILIIPIEEMYFRGFLLPRLWKFGGWSVWINCLLFSTYHVWQMHGLPSIFLGSLPIVTAVWMGKNYRVGMWARIAVSVLAFIFSVLGVMHLHAK